MANHASHAALPYPIKGARFTLLLPYVDADGDPTVPATPDTEISKDNAAAADCAEEVSATSGMDGMSMLTLSGAETDCSCAALNAKVASGPKATLATIYPRSLASIGTGTLSAGSAGGGTLGTVLAYDLTGVFIKTTGGTGGGGTGGANNQARRILTYTPATGAFTVDTWEVTVDNTTTYSLLLPEGVTLGMLKTLDVSNGANWPLPLAAIANDLRLALGLIHVGTAAAITSGTITLASGHGITNTRIFVFLRSGTNATGKARVATYSGSGDVFNVSPPWDANGETLPSGTILLGAMPYPRAAEDELTDQGLVLAQGTIGATGNDTTHLHLAGLAYADDNINDHLLVVLDVSTGVKYTTQVSDWANTGDLATVPTLPFTPQASVDRFWLLSVKTSGGLDAAGVRAAVGLASANLDTQIGDLPTNAELATSAVASVTGAVGSVTGAVGSVTAGVTLANGAHGGAAATLALKSIAVVNSDASGVAVNIEGTGTGNSHALRLQSTNAKALAAGSTNSDAVTIDSGAAKGLVVNGVTADIDANITGTLSGLTAAAIDSILDEAVEGSVTMRQMLRGFASALLSKASGMATTTGVFRDIGDTKPRITVTQDADGNRTAITLDLT